MTDAAPTSAPPTPPPAANAPPSVAALFRRFLGIGCTAFGGPVVQIDTLHREFAGAGGLVSSERFRRALAVYQALPGPEATEMCIWLGTVARGRLGGLLAGLGFVLPGFVLMLVAAALLHGDARWPTWLVAVVSGMQGGALALLLRAAWRLFLVGTHRRAVPVTVALTATLGALLHVPFAVALVGGGFAVLAMDLPRRFPIGALGGSGHPRLTTCVFLAWFAIGALCVGSTNGAPPAAAAVVTSHAELTTLASTGLAAGLLTFGGAYTAIPFLQGAATGPGGWMTNDAMLSGIAVGGVLPAPMVVVGTWVGFAGGGFAGALLLTLGIFLPAFAFPLLLHERLEALTRHRPLHAFLDGVTAAVAGLVVATAITMANAHLVARGTAGSVTTVVALLVLFGLRHRLASPLAMVASGLVGLLLPADL